MAQILAGGELCPCGWAGYPEMFIVLLLCNMENKSKCYVLVAWTYGGELRMIPSLVKECSVPYQDKIDRMWKELDFDKHEVNSLLRISREHEAFARFLMSVGDKGEAYYQYEQAALVCTWCSDEHWLQGTYVDFPDLPLLHRFLSMHGVCRRMAAENDLLRYKYEGSQLQGEYLTFTYDEYVDYQEYIDYQEYRRTCRFGYDN